MVSSKKCHVDWSSRMFWWWWCSVHLLLLCRDITAFNIDTKHPIIFQGSTGSYFGFTVALHNNSEGSLALISAPRSNSSYYGRDVKQPGVLYKCSFDDQRCQELLLDKTGNIPSSVKRRPYNDYKNDMWLGVSLDVQPDEGHVVTCGHLWKNHFIQKNKDKYFPKGVCYVINRDLNINNVRKLLPFIDMSVHRVPEFDMAGFSATFSRESGNELLLGAPGFDQFTGTIVQYTTKRDPADYGNTVIPTLVPNENTPVDSYAGYSITTGQFLKTGEMLVAIGAPRDADLKGKVYIFRVGEHRQAVDVKLRREGEQMGEYFGSTVLGVNLNNDMYTDLLVSAPLHSTKKGDEGKVYVFLSNGNTLEKSKIELMGRKKPGARFGLCLASIGDINQDGFQDVAVGAPYEDGRGAVYIYHGSNQGLNPKIQQILVAKEIDQRFFGFGISVARGQDMDANNYPDLLIGSYASDYAVVLRSSPVVQVSASLKFSAQQIDVSLPECSTPDRTKPCLKATFCFMFKGNALTGTNTLRLLVTLEGDAIKRRMGILERVYFLESGNAVTKVQDVFPLTPYEEKCKTREIFIARDVKDFHTPVRFNLSHELETRQGSDFCKTCPVLDANLPTSLHKDIVFQANCGDDNICKADLKLKARVRDYHKGETWIIGQNKTLIVDMLVENKGELAYQTKMYIVIPSKVDIVNMGGCHVLRPDFEFDTTQTIVCDIANPLKRNQFVRSSIKLDTSQLPLSTKNLRIDVEVETTSHEVNQTDNRVVINLPVGVQVGITMVGFPNSREIFYSKESDSDMVEFSHTYVVTQNRPTPIKTVFLYFDIPIALESHLHTPVQVIHLDSVQYIGDKHPKRRTGSCSFYDPNKGILPDPEADAFSNVDEPYDGTDHFEEVNIVPENRPESGHWMANLAEPQAPEETVSGKMININCSTAYCRKVLCHAGPFEENRKSATFRIDARVNLSALATWKDGLSKIDVIRIVTNGVGEIQDAPAEVDTASADVTTDILKDVVSRGINPWIIVISVLVGILLFCLIFALMYKMNFFQRHRHPQLEEMEKSPGSDDKKSLNPESPEDQMGAADQDQTS